MFHEGTGVPVNTVPPGDFSYYEMLDEIVQNEPATSLDPELMGSLAAIGIIKGRPFAPDDRMKKILEEAAALGNATSRSLFMSPRDPSWFYYPNSSWSNLLFETGYQFETPIPEITTSGVKPYPDTGYRTLNARSYFFYGVTGITPGMAMRLPGVGSQYLLAMTDANKEHFDGGKTYKVALPKGIPEANFWSFTLYDNQTRSMLDLRSATHGLEARASHRRPPSLMQTASRQCTSGRHSQKEWGAAIGCRLCRTKDTS